MTISSQVISVTYTGNGSTTEFPFPFKIFSEDDLIVTLILIADGTEAVTVDYTVADSDITSPSEVIEEGNGSIIFTIAPTASYQIRIERQIDYTQETNIVGAFLPEVVEDQFDREVILAQQLKALLDAAEDAIDDLESRVNALELGGGGGGGGAALVDGDYGDIVVSGSGTVMEFDSSIISSFARTLLNDTSQAAMQATLGVVPSGSGSMTDLLSINMTDSSALAGPVLYLKRTSASPAANDVLGIIIFQGTDAALAQHDYSAIHSEIVTTTAGATESFLAFRTRKAGIIEKRLIIGDGISVPGLTFTGDGTINMFDYFDNGVNINTLYQAKDATLTGISGATITAAGLALLDDASAAAQRTTLSLVVGTNVQAFHALLQSLSGLSVVAGDILYGTGASAMTRLPIGSNGQYLTISGGVPVWGAGAGGGGATLSDGDYGDVTVSAGGAVITIDAAVITLAKMANLATATFIGRTTAGTGVPEALTVTQATALLNALVGDSGAGGTKGLVPAPASGDAAAAKFLKADGTWAVIPGFANNAVSNAILRDSAANSVIGRATNSSGDPADIAAAVDGDVLRLSGTTLGFGAIATAGITDAAVTLAKMANVVTDSLLGRVSASTGVPERIAVSDYFQSLFTAADATAMRALLGTVIGTNVQAYLAGLTTVGIPFIIDGGGVVITTGVKGDLMIPFACTITEWTLLADQSGSIVVNIWMDTYANYPPVVGDKITASLPPTITTATKGQSSTLTSWTVAIPAGSTLRFNVDSVTTIQRVTLILKATKT